MDQAWIGYKEAAVSGMSDFVRQIAGDKLQYAEAGESLQETVARDGEIHCIGSEKNGLLRRKWCL